MKINDILTEDKVDEISIADIKNKLSGARSGMNTSILGRMAGAASKKGMNLTRGLADKFSSSPEVAKNITQGVNAWLQQVKRLQAAGKITQTTRPEDYADLFINFMNQMTRLPKNELNDVKTSLVIGLNSGDGMAALRRAVTAVVGKTLAGSAGKGEMRTKVRSALNNIKQDLNIKNQQTLLQLNTELEKIVSTDPNISLDDLEDEGKKILSGSSNP